MLLLYFSVFVPAIGCLVFDCVLRFNFEGFIDWPKQVENFGFFVFPSNFQEKDLKCLLLRSVVVCVYERVNVVCIL